MAERGYFIVLEGIDNCGKTTQAKLLTDFFKKKGLEVVQTREPGGTKAGEEIRSVLLTPREPILDPVTQTLLFYASRREFIKGVVKPNIEESRIVISDRFEASTYVYQGYTQGVNKQFIDRLHQDVVVASGYKPDLYVIIDITAEESFRRMGNADNQGQDLVYEKQGIEFMKKIREGYLEFAQDQGNVDSSVVVVDGMVDQKKIHQAIIDLLEEITSI